MNAIKQATRQIDKAVKEGLRVCWNEYLNAHYNHRSITEEQWKRFSEIQHATYLIKDTESMARCRKWLESGDDEDAWS